MTSAKLPYSASRVLRVQFMRLMKNSTGRLWADERRASAMKDDMFRRTALGFLLNVMVQRYGVTLGWVRHLSNMPHLTGCLFNRRFGLKPCPMYLLDGF